VNFAVEGHVLPFYQQSLEMVDPLIIFLLLG
jgi:hypothetical protein